MAPKHTHDCDTCIFLGSVKHQENAKTVDLYLHMDELKRGDIFLWRGVSGKYELHMFHSDGGYGAKTFTLYNEEDGSSLIVSYSGICGVLEPNN